MIYHVLFFSPVGHILEGIFFICCLFFVVLFLGFFFYHCLKEYFFWKITQITSHKLNIKIFKALQLRNGLYPLSAKLKCRIQIEVWIFKILPFLPVLFHKVDMDITQRKNLIPTWSILLFFVKEIPFVS